jgi:hypothetical protein
MERTLRKRIAIAAGMVAVMLAVVGPPFNVLSMGRNEPPLRVGMSVHEVFQVMKGVANVERHYHASFGTDEFEDGPDWLGNSRVIVVDYGVVGPGAEYTVTGWQVYRIRPPWLDTALKWVGW